MVSPVNAFQSSVNIFTTLGIPGEMAFDSPYYSKSYILNSSGTPNLVGNAFTVSAQGSPDPAGNSSFSPTAEVGGTGVFAGILWNPKQYASFGNTTNGPLGPTLQLPDYSQGELMTMGELFVYLPAGSNIGDLVVYDTTYGNLSSIPPTAQFTASIAATSGGDVMTVSAISQGNLAVGQLITGAGVTGGTYIASLGTGKGGTGTYILNTIDLQTVSSEAMVATPNSPPTAFTGDGYISTTTLTVTTASTGSLQVGSVLSATGILPDTTITAYGTGKGGTGTYTVSQSQTLFSSGTPGAISTPGYAAVPATVVGYYGSQAAGGVGSIKLRG